MQKIILAVSPDSDFTLQIRSHLEEGGRFQVTCAKNGREALTICNQNFFDVAILDAEINDIPFVPFTRDLVAMQPELKILVYPLQNNPNHPALAGLVSNGFLNKPFFGPEVGNALTNLFTEIETEPQVIKKELEDLANLCLLHPEIGSKRIEQILRATTASTGLLILQGQVIAGSGFIDDKTLSNIMAFLNRYWRDEENNELVRFLKMEGDTSEYLVYAVNLTSPLVLTLIYSPDTSIQKVRSEVGGVKKEFKQVYPTINAIRSDFDAQVIPEQNTVLEPEEEIAPSLEETLEEEKESALPENMLESQSDDDEQTLSDSELKNLDELLSNLPPPDPVEADEDVSVAPLPISELEPAAWIGGLDAIQETESIPAETQENITLETAVADVEEPISEGIPAMEFSDEIVSSSEIQENLSPAEETIAGEEAETASAMDEIPAIETVETLPDEISSFEALEAQSQAEVTPALEISETPISIEETPAAETPFETESVPLPETNMDAEQESTPAEEAAVLPDLPDFNFKLPWETESAAITENTVSEESSSVENETIQSDTASIPDSEMIGSEESDLIRKEPGTTPLGLKGFRFNYSCILIPQDPKQFLAHDLSERLSFILPQIHMAQGWRLTGISIRPLYMLWSVSAPLDTCPISIVQDIRSKTTAHIYSNFPEIAEKYQSVDFWSTSFLALSGNESPSTSLIHDFISQTRKNQEQSVN